jgi:transposase-like protein
LRWVQHYTPEFEKRWQRYARPVGGSWRCDETYIKVKGSWMYLYRAVDKAGKTVDFYLSRQRDVAAAKAFLKARTLRLERNKRLNAAFLRFCTRAATLRAEATS